MAHAQSLLERTPNVNGGWTGSPGVIYFNFLHRFVVSPAPEKQVGNSPTFLLGYAPTRRLLVGVNYATRSDLSARYPNEWELFARVAPVSFASLQAAYNNAAESLDGELGVHYDVGPIRLLAAGRLLSEAKDVALAGGARLRLSRYIALAGDVVSMDDADLGWGAALQIGIPYTPHTLSLHAANTNTATLQGSSRSTTIRRYGFEFTVPFTLARWFGRGEQTAAAAAVPEDTAVSAVPRESPGGAMAETAPVVVMKNMQFVPQTIVVKPGTTVVWRNDDQLAHTVTAANKSWTSPLMDPGATFRHTFASAGRHEIICTPHPFMKAVVEVKP